MLKSAREVDAKIKTGIPGRWSVGDGAYLQVARTGKRATASWLFRYWRDGRTVWVGLGPVSLVSLAEARDKANRGRKLRLDGIDPLEDKRARREAQRAEERTRLTFREAALRFLAVHEAGWRNAKHRAQWRTTLEVHACPKLGGRPVAGIDQALINETLAPIWAKTPETASRVKQRIERVLTWVKDGMPLPAPNAAKRVKHHAALAWQEVPAFMARLRSLDSISARALEFAVLTAARTGETIGATWDEVDLDAKLWTIPAARMKGHREHRVPLSDRALEILSILPREVGNSHVLIGRSAGFGLSNMAMLSCLKGLDDSLTTHGFRSAFRDWAAEATHYPNHVVEMALAHAIGNAVEAAYRRGDLLAKRRKLMADWAAYCASPAAGAVVLPIQRQG